MLVIFLLLSIYTVPSTPIKSTDDGKCQIYWIFKVTILFHGLLQSTEFLNTLLIFIISGRFTSQSDFFFVVKTFNCLLLDVTQHLHRKALQNGKINYAN